MSTIKKHLIKIAEGKKSEYFPISVPAHSEDAILFRKIYDEGSNSDDGFPRSSYSYLDGRLNMKIHRKELPYLMRRLRDIEEDDSNYGNGESWVESIEEALKQEMEEYLEKEEEDIKERNLQEALNSIDPYEPVEAKTKSVMNKKSDSVYRNPGELRVEGIFEYPVNGWLYEFAYNALLFDIPTAGRDQAEVQPTGYPSDLPNGWLEDNLEQLEEAAINRAWEEVTKQQDQVKESVKRKKKQLEKDHEQLKKDIEEIRQRNLQEALDTIEPYEPIEASNNDLNIRMSIALRKAMKKLSQTSER